MDRVGAIWLAYQVASPCKLPENTKLKFIFLNYVLTEKEQVTLFFDRIGFIIFLHTSIF